MYKARIETGEIIKKDDLREFCEYILEERLHLYKFFVEYTPYTHDAFFKLILMELKDFDCFYSVYTKLNGKQDYIDFIEERIMKKQMKLMMKFAREIETLNASMDATKGKISNEQYEADKQIKAEEYLKEIMKLKVK